jgi:4-amino-4-deoxy-L-arabinose transferase-like glycosyltransferase
LANHPPSADAPTRDWRDAATFAAAVALLILFWVLAVSAAARHSQTSDELPHITAGYAYNHFGDFRIQPENGNLPQRVYGLPGQVLGARFPMDDQLWRHSTYWQLGWNYFYDLGNPTDRIVFWARALNALFGVALGVFIFQVARDWYGRAGGLLALGLYALCPNFLAHSGLATSDITAALFLTVAPWFFWRHLARRDLTSGLLAGLLGGLALVSKFNGVLLAPIYAVLVVADAWLAATPDRGRRLGVNAGLACAQGLIGIAVIWTFYNFRYSTAAPGLPPLEAFAWPWDKLLQGIGWKASFIELARDWHLLPEAWLYGLSTVLAGSVARPSFLAGQYSLHGWWQFFPTLFLIKTPLALLSVVPISLGVAAVRWRRASPPARAASLRRWLPLAVTALMVWLTAILSNLNIGHRHILAVYPVLFIAAGSLATLPSFWRIAVPCLLLAGQAFESFSIRPHYLAFFNPLGGGPENAYRLVVDSSLDWGQDLPALREWLEHNRRPGEPLNLSYFGSAWPPHYGVRPTHFLPAVNIARPPRQDFEYEPGLYCISATSLAGVYSDYRGSWRAEWEQLYRTVPHTTEEFDELRFARLCKYLQFRAPDAEAGYSILIYRLNAAELQTALHGPVKGW